MAVGSATSGRGPGVDDLVREAERLQLTARSVARLRWILDSAANVTPSQSEQIANAITEVTIGAWGWSAVPSSSLLGRRHDDFASAVRQSLDAAWMDHLGTASWGYFGDLRSLARNAGDAAGRLAKSASRNKGLADMYASQIAEVAVGLTINDAYDDDREWNALTQLWDEVVVRRVATDYPDPDAVAWRNKPGSISWCLSRTLSLMALALFVMVLSARLALVRSRRDR